MATADRIAVYALTRPAARLAANLAKALNQARILEEGAHKGKLGSEIREPGTESVQRRTDNAERTTQNGERGTSTTDLYLPASLAQEFGGQGFTRLREIVAETFHRYTGHVFLTAAGIAVRGIAPLLQGKEKDPAVVVLDQKGEYAVSLLSGHLGGGNRLAREMAAILGGRAVITTATDSLGLPAVEELARDAEMRIKDLRAATPVNAALANWCILQFHDPGERLGLVAALGPEFPLRRIEAVEEIDPDHAAIWVDWHRAMQAVNYGALVLHPRCLVAGVGCNRGTDEEEILQLIRSVFYEFDLALESLACLATTSVKREEVGLIRAAEALEVPLVCLEAEELGAVSVPNPSETVSKHMGVASVCEAAALHQARTTTLLLPKRKSANATLALAVAGSPQSASARGEKST